MIPQAPPVVIAETIVEDALEQLEVDEMPGLSARPEEVPMFPPGAFEIPEELPGESTTEIIFIAYKNVHL